MPVPPATSAPPPLWTTRKFPPVTAPVGVLIVDDDDRLAEALKAALRADGFDARTADCVACFTLVGVWTPHAIVIDIEMPGASGYEVARAFRQMPHLRLAPIVAHTSLSEAEVLPHGTAVGMDAYCQKGHPPAVLLALLRHMAPLRK